MDVLETLKARLEEIGHADAPATVAVRASPRATVEDSQPTTQRELPKISVALHGTLPGADREPPATSESAMRDLEVIRTLGEGGMGRVFLARQHSLEREVAIKTVRDTASQRERLALLSEGAITGHLEHPAIIPVHALGVEEEGRPVLVMKRVEGVEWTELLDDPAHPLWRDRGAPEGDRLDAHLEILMQVCNAAHFAHSRGIVHRDVKPQNVFIGRYGEVYLGDWGAAVRLDRQDDAHALCGTPAYMAPEMVLGARVDERADVYLLGATLHHVLVGAPRHAGKDVQSALRAALRSEPFAYPERVPEQLAALANRATARDPKDRPASAAELRESIAQYLRHKTSIALARSAIDRMAKLRALAEEEGAPTNEAAQGEVEQLVVEARFALKKALEDWSSNEAAARALRELDDLLAARRARAAHLERMARDLDPRVASRPRTLLFAALVVVGVGLAVSGTLRDPRDITPRGELLESMGPLAVVGIAFAVLRKRLASTSLNRNAAASLLAVVAGITVDRAIGMLAGTPAPTILVHDLVLLAVASAVSAALMFRWIAWCAPILIAGAIAAATLPMHAMRAFSIAAGLAQLVLLGFLWRMGDSK